MFPDATKLVAIPDSNVGISGAADKSRAKNSIPFTARDSESAEMPRMYSAESDISHPGNSTIYPITRKTNGEPSMLIDRLKGFDLTVREHELPAWRSWLASMEIGPAVLDVIAQRAANLDSVWTAITANPLEKIRPAVKAICWAGVLADLDVPAGNEPQFNSTDEAQLKRLANAGRTAEQDLASAVARMHDICSAFIDDYGHVKVVSIHRELTGKYGMASPYAERVGTAYAYAWGRRQQPGSLDLQRSFAAQLKQDIDSSDFADRLAGIAEESGNRATCQMLLRRQHDMLLKYCEEVPGRSTSTS